MIDLIVFNVANNIYALSIENVIRISELSELTKLPNAHKLIDGIMSFEDKTVKVLNFRKLVGLNVHEEDATSKTDKEQKDDILQKPEQHFCNKSRQYKRYRPYSRK